MGFIPRGGFRPAGRVSFPTMGKKPKDRRGKTHIAVGNKFPPAPVRFPPDPRLRGIPLYPHVIFPARKLWFRVLAPPGPLGPGAVQNFGLHHFTTAPGSDQPWQRVRDGRTPIRPQWPPQAAPNAKPSEAGLRWRGEARDMQSATPRTRPPISLRRDWTLSDQARPFGPAVQAVLISDRQRQRRGCGGSRCPSRA